MNRGCIAVDELQCDGCQRKIKYGERYLLIEDTEDEKTRFCIECCLSRGYAAYETDKGRQVLTFFSNQS